MGNGKNDEACVQNDVDQAERVPSQRPLADPPLRHRKPYRRDLRGLRDQREGGGHGSVEPERSLLTQLAVPGPFLEELRAGLRVELNGEQAGRPPASPRAPDRPARSPRSHPQGRSGGRPARRPTNDPRRRLGRPPPYSRRGGCRVVRRADAPARLTGGRGPSGRAAMRSCPDHSRDRRARPERGPSTFSRRSQHRTRATPGRTRISRAAAGAGVVTEEAELCTPAASAAR